MAEQYQAARRVAEIVHFRGCFSIKSRKAPTLDVLNDVLAAERVLQDQLPAVVWLDLQAGALFLTERWGADVTKQRLPLQLDVAALEQPLLTSDKELIVATISFSDRQSLELFVKLGQQVLPAWLSMRQGALNRNLLTTNGHWLVSYLGKALRLQSTAHGCTGLVELNLHKPGIGVLMPRSLDPSRVEAVGSLQAATRALHRHNCQKQRYDSRVVHHIQHLQPTAAAVQKLQGRLQASAELKQDAPSMSAWISSGIMAALVDCAAGLTSCEPQQQLNNNQLNTSGCCSRLQAVIQGLADCVHVVLEHAGDQACQQAQLLVSCVAKSLCDSSTADASMVAALLTTVLKGITGSIKSESMWDPLRQACQDPLLLQQILWCYSRATAYHQAMLNTQSTAMQLSGPQSTQQRLELPSGKIFDLFPSSDSARTALGPYSHPLTPLLVNQPCYEDTSPRRTAAGCHQADDASNSPKRPVVPRLSLPSAGPGTPTVVARSSRLSRRASDVNSLATPGATLQSAANSALSALQQLGHSCGESVMASDLAAFVTHKQQHNGQNVVMQQGRRVLSRSLPGGSYSDLCVVQQPPAPPAGEDWNLLPRPLQLQLHLLNCLDMLTKQWAAAGLPVSADHVLLEQQLLPRSVLLQRLQAGRRLEHLEVLHKALDWQRHVALKVVVRCHGWKCAQQLLRCSHDDDTRDTGPRLHDSVIAQFKQRLLDYCSIKRPDASIHEACREALLLLRDFLVQASRPHLVDLTCSMIGRALGQQEYMLRSSRVALWSWPAVRHMDALVQLYTELMRQASSTSAIDFLLQTLGTQQVASNISSSGHSSSGGAAGGSAPADTLQLLLEYLQQRLPAAQTAAAWSARDSGRNCSSRASHSAARGPSATAHVPCTHSSSPGCNACLTNTLSSCASPSHGELPRDAGRSSLAGVPEDSAAADQVTGDNETEAIAYRRHCWELLTAVLELASRQTSSSTLGVPATSNVSWGGSSSPARTSIIGSEGWVLNRFTCEEGSQRLLLRSDTSRRAAATAAVSSADSTRSSEADQQPQQQQIPSPKRLQQLSPRESTAGSEVKQPETSRSSRMCSPGRVPSLSITLLPSSSSSSNYQPLPRPVHLQPAGSMSFSSVTGSTPGSVSGGGVGPSSDVFKVLVELLLRQRAGRAYVVQQLEEMDGSQIAVPLQLVILRFLATAVAVPQSYAHHVPQMLEFYVHYHFLNFTRHYHKLPIVASPAAVACCKGHMKVLLALCSHVSGANPVRRRFLQLKILEFLIREVGLEYNLRNRQLLGLSGSNSCYSTPQSTNRSLVAPGSSRGVTAPSSGRSSVAPTTAGASVSRLGSAIAVAAAAVVDVPASTDNCPVGDKRQIEYKVLPAEPAAQQRQQQLQQQSHTVHAEHTLIIPAAGTAGIAPRHAGSIVKVRKGGGKQRSSTPELYTMAAGRRAGGVTSYSRVAARQRRKSGTAATAAAGDVSRTSVKLAVRRFEAAAAAAAAAPSAADVRAPSAGRRLVLPSQTAAAMTAQSSSSSMSRPNPHQQQILQPRPPEARLPAVTAAVSLYRGARVVAQSQSDVAGQRSRQGTCRSVTAMVAGSKASQCMSSNSVHSSDYGTDSNSPSSNDGASTDHDSSTSCSSDQASPRQDLDGDTPPSMLRKQRPQQPQLTGDTSVDDRLITEWEEQTGCDFIFDGLSDHEEEDNASQSDDAAAGTSHAHSSLDHLITQQTSEAPIGRAVPPLTLGLPGTQQATPASAAATATDSDDDYRPGFDLEEDFERMMHAEEAGGPDNSHWPVSSSDSDSDDSSYIAAGRQHSGSEDSGPEDSADDDHRHDRALGQPIAAAGGGDSGVDALGLQDDELEEQLLVSDTFRAHHASTVTSTAQHRIPARNSLVPHLNLPTDTSAASRLQQQLLAASAAPNSSPGLTPVTRGQAPSLLDSATPLVTTRPSAAVAAARTAGAAATGAQTPAAAAHHQQDTGTSAPPIVNPQSAAYHMHRQAGAVYVDQELQVLCLELALHLLGTPMGSLDQLQLPQEPADLSLQHKVQVLIDHLSHPDNHSVVQLIAQRASKQQQTALGAAAAVPWPAAGSGWFSDSATAAVSAAAGLGTCTLRLLKLLSSGMLDPSQLQMGGIIQKGAFSEVHAGTLLHTSGPTAVAVKTLECSDSDSSCFERVYNEVAILEGLQGQQGIVPLLEYGVMCDVSDNSSRQQPQWGLVFPRYSGSLREWRCRRVQSLQLQDVELYLHVFLQVATIVRDLHAANVVHYDIKGDNLLLDHSPDDAAADSRSSRSSLSFSIVLADFGDALMLDGAAAVAERHRGTELFSSPEMLLLHAGQQHPEHFAYDRRKAHGVGRPHDVWSLGCTLYELLTGRTLFEEQGVGRITSLARSSCAGGPTLAPPGVKAGSDGRYRQQARGASSSTVVSSQRPRCGGVLTSEERATLCHHEGLVDLLEFMLVGDANWRPGAAEVVYKTQQLLLTCGRSRS